MRNYTSEDAAELLVAEGYEEADDQQMARSAYAFFQDPYLTHVWAAVCKQDDGIQALINLRNGDVEDVQFTSKQMARFGITQEECECCAEEE